MVLNHAEWLSFGYSISFSLSFQSFPFYAFLTSPVKLKPSLRSKWQNPWPVFRPKLVPHLYLFLFQDVPIPWKAIFTSLPLWAIVLAHFTQTWGLYTMMSELPLYFNQRLHLDLNQVTIASNNNLTVKSDMFDSPSWSTILDCILDSIMATVNRCTRTRYAGRALTAVESSLSHRIVKCRMYNWFYTFHLSKYCHFLTLYRLPRRRPRHIFLYCSY